MAYLVTDEITTSTQHLFSITHAAIPGNTVLITPENPALADLQIPEDLCLALGTSYGQHDEVFTVDTQSIRMSLYRRVGASSTSI